MVRNRTGGTHTNRGRNVHPAAHRRIWKSGNRQNAEHQPGRRRRHAVSDAQPSPKINPQDSWRKLIWMPIAIILARRSTKRSELSAIPKSMRQTWKIVPLAYGPALETN